MIYKNKLRKAPSVCFLMGIIYAIVGIIFLIVGITISVHNNNFLKNAQQTNAVISQIEKEYYNDSDGERKTKHSVCVKYEINGRQYEELLDYYSSDMREGDTIIINYSPDDPSKIITNMGSKILGFVIIPLGSIFALLGFILIMKKIHSDQKRNKLIQSGECLTGIITNVERNMYVTINKIHPYKAECEVIDPYSNEKFLYSSDNIMGNISVLIGREVTVYIDSKNKKNYFVDIYELLERNSSGENICDHEHRG